MTRRPDPDEAHDVLGDDQRYLHSNRLVGALTLMGPLDPLLATVLRELRLRVYPAAPGSGSSDYVVLDLHGVSIAVQRRPSDLHLHVDTSETADTLITVEINGGGEHEHPTR